MTALQNDLASLLSHAEAVRDALTRQLAGNERAAKTVAQTVTRFENTLTRFTFDTFHGKMDATDLRRAMKELIRALGPEAYDEGLREGGVDPEDADEDDLKRVREWVRAQVGFVDGYAQAAAEARTDEEKKAVRARIADWVSALQALGDQGYMSAKENMSVTWRLGKTEKHCSTCASLDGKRRRLKWWLAQGYIPQESGSDTLECGGWECLCRLEDAGGRTVVPR